MKIRRSIQFKAAFLLVVFSLNTLIGFACAAGIDMGFNRTHHHDEEATKVSMHEHANGKKHIHHNETGKHHDETSNHHHKSKDNKDNCCNDKVAQFSQLDKAVPPSLHLALNPIFFTPFISSFYNIDVLFSSQQKRAIKYFIRSHHPPIADIRIAIQSFQI